ncbi:MAG: hypothetical protein OEV00_00900, partial [Acidobacteriota bacterium]|nr:hypothetical protein [Acidobacteriota bacterium]
MLAHNGEPVDPETEGEAGDLFRVQVHRTEDLRVNHSGTPEFDPAGPLADPASRAVAHRARDVVLATGL